MAVYEDESSRNMAICSDLTLFSDPRGFFRTMSDDLLEVAKKDNWLENVLVHTGDDSAKIMAVLENKELKEDIDEILYKIQPMWRGKDYKVSGDKRMRASISLKRGDLKQALAWSCQAVVRAPMPDEEESNETQTALYMALWQRSEILLMMGKPVLALEDLNNCRSAKFSNTVKAQYYWRLGNCFKGTNIPRRATVCFEIAKKLMEKDPHAMQKIQKDIDELGNIQKSWAPLEPPPVLKEATLTGGGKTSLPSLSNLVKIAYTTEKGRFAVATSHIKTGDVLLLETPYAACLLPEKSGTHCHHCFKRLQSSVWCQKCSAVAFCSVKCRDEALTSYHVYECPFGDLFLGSGMSILTHLALRMVTQAGFETSLLIYSKFIASEMKVDEDDVARGTENLKNSKITNKQEASNDNKSGEKCTMGNPPRYEPNKNENISKRLIYGDKKERAILTSAEIVYSLCTNADKRKPEDFFKRIVVAMFLKECLKKGDFFKNCNDEDLPKNEMAILELLLRNIQLLQFNAHEIYETIRDADEFRCRKISFIAIGIYPTGSLFNHGCYPAVTRLFEGKNIVFRAIRPLTNGEEVSENYGPHVQTMCKLERQKSLAARYWFKCQCVACIEDWPLVISMNRNAPPKMKCINVKCDNKFETSFEILPDICPKCCVVLGNDLKSNVEMVKDCVQKYSEGENFMENKYITEAISVLSRAVDLFHGVAMPPHRYTHIAQSNLRSCFADFGNVHIFDGFGEKIRNTDEWKEMYTKKICVLEKEKKPNGDKTPKMEEQIDKADDKTLVEGKDGAETKGKGEGEKENIEKGKINAEKKGNDENETSEMGKGKDVVVNEQPKLNEGKEKAEEKDKDEGEKANGERQKKAHKGIKMEEKEEKSEDNKEN